MSEQQLEAIEAYYDAAPRSSARVEDHPPFRLFVSDGKGWPFYARPLPDATTFTADDVAAMRARQRELGVPEAFEWIGEMAPSLAGAAEGAGLAVAHCPLMVRVAVPVEAFETPGIELRLVSVEDDLRLIGAVAPVGFAAPGTSVGDAGIEALQRAAAGREPERVAFERERLRAGLAISAVALADGVPVGIGSHQPVGSVSEVVGVATLPSFRRRGIAAAITGMLVRDALARGVETVFLSAGDDTIARVYERAGFRRIATACIAEPTPRSPLQADEGAEPR